MEFKHRDLTDKIINAFYEVYNTLGYGFLEKVYENALAHELRKRGFKVVQQAPIHVNYDGVIVGEYYADLVVNDAVILELKSVEAILDDHKAQLLNYLKATDIDVGLALNFGPRPQISRKVFEIARHPRSH